MTLTEVTGTRPPYPTQAVIEAWTWYVVPNDCAGGWSIATTNAPTSQQNPEKGGWWVADAQRDVATEIVRLHNALLAHRSVVVDLRDALSDRAK